MSMETSSTLRGAIFGASNFRFATVSRDRPTESCKEASSSKMKMCVSLQQRLIKNLEMHVLLQRRAQKCMKQVSDAHSSSRHSKIWTSDEQEIKEVASVSATSRICVSPQSCAPDKPCATKRTKTSLSQQPFSAAILSHPQPASCCGQGLVVSY